MIGPSTFVLISSRFCQLLENSCHKHHSIEVFSVCMHLWFLETNALLLLHVVETMVDAIITRKKWLNKALTTQKPHRNHLQPTDQPVLKLLHNIAHAGLEIPSTSAYHRKSASDLLASFKIKTGRNSLAAIVFLFFK